ncbi:MAG: hypothetical protein JWM09_170 [Francisellaceae bacterium]|nr:hypothetical protein [Francisellaceae bacterium]
MHIQPLFLNITPTHFIENFENKVIQFNEMPGYNKSGQAAMINAENDVQAISSFLLEYRDSPETYRSYAKEIERLLLWCHYTAGINLSSLRREHFIEYQNFLKMPSPFSMWCGPKVPRKTKEGSINPYWRPFCKGLTASSIHKTIKILDSFFNYLVQTNYLLGNPLAIDRKRKKRHQIKPRIVDRYLELDEIQSVLQALNDYPASDDIQNFQVLRARYIILLFFYTGLRISEASKHRMGDFLQREGNWFLKVVGKGNKLREIPIPDELLKALGEFRIANGLKSSEPKFKEVIPLIPMQNLKEAIGARRIDQIIRWAFNLGATRFEGHEPHKASKLKAASTHWLRHSYVTYLLNSGASIKTVQENAGHSDISTTMLYRHVAQGDRHQATKYLSVNNPQKKDKNSPYTDNF